MRDVFAQPDAVRQSVSWLGVLLLVGAALSFTRGLQRVYERSWRLEARGLAGTRAGLIWIAGIVVWSTVFTAAREWLLDLAGPLGSLTILLAGDARCGCGRRGSCWRDGSIGANWCRRHC